MVKKLVIVAGGRKYSNLDRVRAIINEESPTFIIEGDAPGADSLAGVVAHEYGIPFIKVPAQWRTHGKSAGYKRNVLMIQILVRLAEDNEMKLIAFAGGVGTKMMVREAEARGIPVRRVDW